MKDKYGMEFKFKDSNTKVGSGDVFGSHSEYVNILVTCDEMPDTDIQVYSGDGETFCDDLIALKYEDKAEELILEAAEEIYGGDPARVMLYHSSNVSELTLPADTSFEDFVLSGAIGWTEICTDDSKAPLDDFRRLVKLLQEKKINCNPTVFYFTDNSYTDISAEKPVGAVDYAKQICQLRLDQLCNVMDAKFNGSLMIYRQDMDNAYPTLEPAADETPDTYAAYFKPRSEKMESTMGDVSIVQVEMPDIPDIPTITEISGE